MRRSTLLTLVIAAGMVATACGGTSGSSGGGGSQSNTGKIGGKLVIDNESGGTWSCQFNPFNSGVNGTSIGFTYEPLYFVDALATNADGSNKTTPWLATKYEWGTNYTTLTFTIRSGVTWSDGTPFSAQDVLYTYNAMKSDSALDINALWQADGGPITGVALQGSDQVVFTFSGPAQTYFFYVADQTPIVPQHIWQSQDQTKLDQYADSQPIGTGPYTVSSCSANNIKYTRNAHYWQSTSGHPVPQIQEVDYPAFLSNTPANLLLHQGGAQWGAQYIPNIQQYYISQDPTNRHYWFPPVANVGLFLNMSDPLVGQLAVRQAIALAIDRHNVSQRGEDGYQAAANQTGIILPTYKAWYDKSQDNTSFSPSKAGQVLQAAGFAKGSDGIYQSASGQRLSFTIQTITGYTDWDSSLQVIQQELKTAGIEVKVVDEDNGSVYVPNLQAGKFTLAYGEETGGPAPYYELRQMLFSGNIGSTNYSRYNSPATDALFDQYASATASQQVQIIHQISSVLVNDVPFVPVTEGVDWYQYDTKNIGGWPTPSNPYAQPPVWALPDNGVVLTHLYPIG
jgi:peptide/nickel transport system substrate-binding protein